jgi:hypothetical protein
MKVSFARSATKHRVSRDRSKFVIEHCGDVLEIDPPAGAPADASKRLLYLGNDDQGIPLEVMAVQVEGGVHVLHAMQLREKYRAQYDEVIRWVK